VDRAVLAAVGLEAFKALLAIVQGGSLSFEGRFLENSSRLRQLNSATRLRSVTVFSVIGFSRPDSIGA
ncbi:hypothetical protein, partial [Pseudomonas edaphica]|uniref:hypothetical protein n=1 Tax=Pseudomonas edaphica TaxID=2006980 RepID=UPI001F20F68A